MNSRETRAWRQTHLVAAVMLSVSIVLSKIGDPRWIALALLPIFGLTLHATTGFCPMEAILRRAPWNRI